MDFNYYLPVNIVFGRGKVSSVGIIASDHGKKALVVTGKNQVSNILFLIKYHKILLQRQLSKLHE